MGKTVSQLLIQATNKLRSITDTPSLDASLLFEEATGLNKVKQITYNTLEIDDDKISYFNTLIERRLNSEPIAYILEKKEFYSREFKVNKHTLIPRPDTETIIEEVNSYINSLDFEPKVLDLCTGSGCIAITLALENDLNEISLSDISPEALEVAKYNANKLYSKKINIIESNLLENCDKYDIIVSNPPYLTRQWCEEVSDEVKKEPILALEGFGEDGLDLIRKIIIQSKNHLIGHHSAIFFECDSRQCEKVKELLKEANFINIEIIKDLANKDRIVKGIYER
jgi:release factor glutamine methyltransferase